MPTPTAFLKKCFKAILIVGAGLLIGCQDQDTSISNLVNANLEQSSCSVAVGEQASVPVTFTTNTGTANNLSVNLSALPSNWSQANAESTFTCTSVQSSGTSCQLNLVYAPTQLTTNGLLSLTYTYTASDGTLKSGTVNISYNTTPSNIYMTALDGASTGVYQCPLASNGSFSACNTPSDNSFNGENGIAIQTTNGNTFAYVSNSNNDNVSVCGVSNNGALITPCTTTASGTTPQGITFATILGNTFAYIPNGQDPGGAINYCTIDPNDGTLSCNPTGSNLAFPTSITFQQFGTNTYAYIINQGNTFPSTPFILKCLAKSDGEIGSCSQMTLPSNLTLNAPTGLAFQTINGTTYAYITAYDNVSRNNVIDQCAMTTNGIFTGADCIENASYLNGAATGGIGFAGAQNGNTYAYLPDGNNEVIMQCQVDPSTGTLQSAGSCAQLQPNGSPFAGTQPYALTFH